jgi:hypothetical protein
MVFILLFIIIFPYAIQTCHPECNYACTDPVCAASCKIITSTPRCDICFRDLERNTSICSSINNKNCVVSCPPDECESDQCPSCEILCNPLCRDDPLCYIECQEIQSSWKCSVPTNCPLPICVLLCEAPACQYSSNTRNSINIILLSFITLLFV